MEIQGNQINQSFKYSCKICNFNTDHNARYEEHLKTIKHRKLTNPEPTNTIIHMPISNTSEEVTSKHFFCKFCEKEFMNRSGLWKHNKKCNSNKNELIINNLKQTVINEIKTDIITNEEQLKYQQLQLQIKYYELKIFLMNNKEILTQNGVTIPQGLLE